MPAEKFKIIPTVYLILVEDKKILLLRRYNTGFHDGEYSFPAGHLRGNETLREAMVREAREEIGVELDLKDLKLIHIMHRKEPTEERVNFFFPAKKWIGELKITEPSKCDDLSWFALGNLPENIIPYIKQVINCFKDNIFYSEFG